MNSNVPKFIQRYNDQMNRYAPQITPQGAAQQYGQNPNASTGYSLNNNYAVGARVYNGSSPSPQVGAGSVDPSGYATRDNMAQTRNQLLAGYANQAGN